MRFPHAGRRIDVANDSNYGLAAAVWTNDLTKAHKVARGIKAETIWVNTAATYDRVSRPEARNSWASGGAGQARAGRVHGGE